MAQTDDRFYRVYFSCRVKTCVLRNRGGGDSAISDHGCGPALQARFLGKFRVQLRPMAAVVDKDALLVVWIVSCEGFRGFLTFVSS